MEQEECKVKEQWNHYTLTRMIKIQNTDNNKYWQGCGAAGALIYSWWECKVVQPTCKTVQWALTKLNILKRDGI